MEFYVKSGYPKFDKAIKQYLKEKGFRESSHFPVDFVFVSGEHAYQRNRINTRKSKWISLLWGKSVDKLTNKITLHKQEKPYLIPSQIITDSIPQFRSLKILKPLGGFSGSGITIVNNTKEAEHWISTQDYKEWLLQPYIKSPALKDGHKFHLRVYVLIKLGKEREVFVSTHKVYVKAKEKYKEDDWLNPDIHDTHYSEGKLETFPQESPDGWDLEDTRKANKKISLILADLLENEHDFKPEWNAIHGFEVFGVDILFDKHKPYILEFNNKMGLKQVEWYAEGIVDTVFGNPNSYFTRIL